MKVNDQEFPDRLYRYRLFYDDNRDEKWLKPFFTESLLYHASPESFNDPYDCRFHISYHDIPHEEKEKFLNEFITEVHPDLSDTEKIRLISILIETMQPANWQDIENAGHIHIQPKVYSTFGIVSLTERNNDIVMWSHYSKSHTGICIELDTSIFRNSPNLERVEYSQDYPSYKIFNEYRKKGGAALQRLFLTRKAEHWKYENEWRIIIDLRMHNYQRLLPYRPEMLNGIIFGCRMEEKHKEMIREWIKDRDPKPQLYEARINNERYALDIIPIE